MTMFSYRCSDVEVIQSNQPGQYMGMGQYLYIPFLGDEHPIYQLFWGSPGVPGFWPIPIYELFQGGI